MPSVKELREHAKLHGIRGYTRLTKDELKTKLTFGTPIPLHKIHSPKKKSPKRHSLFRLSPKHKKKSPKRKSPFSLKKKSPKKKSPKAFSPFRLSLKKKSPKKKSPKRHSPFRLKKKTSPKRKLSPYNKFLSKQIRRLKTAYPRLSTRARFAKAAKNWKLSGSGVDDYDQQQPLNGIDHGYHDDDLDGFYD